MKILICDQLNEKVLDELKTLGECFDISLSDNKDDEINENIVDSEIVVIRSGTVLNREILELAKNIKIIARCGVGVDNIDLEFAKQKKNSCNKCSKCKYYFSCRTYVLTDSQCSKKNSTGRPELKKW